ncbi:MAG: DUF433 domain-containing protein [Chitinophagaceae bacterium]|nr:DUF433 domain-containing protein [Chitinophagaceae bacterium]
MNRLITILPDVCNGKPTVRGLRITVHTMLSHLAAGDIAKDILHAYPDLTADDIKACLDYAASIADKPVELVTFNNKVA